MELEYFVMLHIMVIISKDELRKFYAYYTMLYRKL